MEAVLKDDDWRVFIQLMYDKVNALANKP
jgi:hypothetical protein